jgi:hypothetical protein
VSRERLLAARLAALFLLGWLGFNTPPLRLASRDVWVLGLPLPWLYLLSVWTLLIALVAVMMRPPRGE